MLIGFTGKIGSGKSLLAGLLVEKFGFTKLSFADSVREMAVALDPYVHCGTNRHFTEGDTPFARYTDVLKAVGYAQAKTYPDVRRTLQRLGTEAVRGVLGDDVLRTALVHKIGALTHGFPLDANIVIDDVRFDNEAEMLKQLGGHIVFVQRSGHDSGVEVHHSSEDGIGLQFIDCSIENREGEMDALLAAGEAAFAQFVAIDETERLSYEPSVPEPPRVYIAATFENKANAIALKQALMQAGVRVVSTWTEREASEAVTAAQRRERAIVDRDEVRKSTVLILLAEGKSEGKSTEYGMAVTYGMRVIVVGADVETQNVFYNLPEVEHVATDMDAIILLGANPPGVTLIPVIRVGNAVVASETGQVIATKLGVITEAPDSDIEHDLARHSGESGKD